MGLFDFNVGLGRGADPVGGAFDTAAELLTELRRLGVGEALVYHRVAAEADVEAGNRALLDALAGHASLYPCWVMVPPTLGDFPKPAAWVREAREWGVRAVRLYPRHSLYTLADWCVGPLLTALQDAELPLLLDFGDPHWSEQVIPWGDIQALCDAYPGLPVVVVGATSGTTRDAVAVLQRVSNLHLELHAFNAAGVLHALAQVGLARQLLFGTGMPVNASECSVGHVLASGLDQADLRAVTSANARRLLGTDAHEPEGLRGKPVSRSATGYAAFAKRGRPQRRKAMGLRGRRVSRSATATYPDAPPLERQDCPVIDVHAHYGAWERTITLPRTPEAIVAAMDRTGVDKLIGSSFTAIHGEMRRGNEQTEAFCEAFPQRLYGYCAINPHYPGEIEAELRRCFEDSPHFVGLKFHCGLHAASLSHPGYEAALAYADAHGLPVLVHGGGDRALWETVAARYPNASFIMAHACAWDGVDLAGREFYGLARDATNIHVDVAGSRACRGALRALVDLVGPDKVLYGSDFPMFDLAWQVARIAGSDLTVGQQTALCSGNALRLFDHLRNR